MKKKKKRKKIICCAKCFPELMECFTEGTPYNQHFMHITSYWLLSGTVCIQNISRSFLLYWSSACSSNEEMIADQYKHRQALLQCQWTLHYKPKQTSWKQCIHIIPGREDCSYTNTQYRKNPAPFFWFKLRHHYLRRHFLTESGSSVELRTYD